MAQLVDRTRKIRGNIRTRGKNVNHQGKNRERLRVLITGAYSSLNAGTCAMAITAVESLKKFLGNPEFVICSLYQDIDVDRYENILLPQYDVKVTGIRYRKRNIWPLNAVILLLRSIPCYVKADVIIDVAGIRFSGVGYWEVPIILFESLMFLFGVLLGKPVILYAQSLGPLRSGIARSFARSALNRISLITVRGKSTLNYLNDLGISKSIVHLTSDSAFLLKPASAERVNEILAVARINKDDQPLIGIAPSQEMSSKRYLKLMANVIEQIVSKLGATVMLVSHVTLPDNDDRIVAKKIYQLVKSKHKVRLDNGVYTPNELKGIIGRCDLFIGCRMHSAIASLSMHVPTLVMVHGYRGREIMDMLGQEEYVVSPSCSSSEIISKFDSCWSRRNRIKKELIKKIKCVQERALLNATLVSQLLQMQGNTAK